MSSESVCYQLRDTGHCRFGARCKFSHDIAGAQRSSPTPATVTQSSSALKAKRFKPIRQRGPIAEFFHTQYPRFNYNNQKGAVEEWRRLCTEHLFVDPDNSEAYVVRASRRNLRTAMVRQFNQRFGEDEDDLGAWQRLCMKVDIPVPDNIADCKKALSRTHVNLVDLTEMEEDDPPTTKYRTVQALSAYSLRTHKIFPRDHVEAGSLLKTLLRQINSPPLSRPGPGHPAIVV